MEVRTSPHLSFFGDLYYSSFGLDGDELINDSNLRGQGFTVSGGDAVIFVVNGGARFFPLEPSIVNPYLTLGAGLLGVSTENILVESDTSFHATGGEEQNRAGMFFGAGVHFTMTRTVAFLLEFNYSLGFTHEKETTFFPLRAGFRFRI